MTRAPAPPGPARHPATPDKGRAAHHRGDVWLVAADPEHPSIGTEIWSGRPAVVVSNDVLNAGSGFAQVVYVTGSLRKRPGPTHVRIPSWDARYEASTVLCEQVHTVDASRLVRRLSIVGDSCMRRIDAAVAFGLQLPLQKKN